MSGDEDRRRLEREARYEGELASLLACMRDGHVPQKFVQDGEEHASFLVVLSRSAIFSPADARIERVMRPPFTVNIRLCKRCRLTYWDDVIVPRREEPGIGEEGIATTIPRQREQSVLVDAPCACIDHDARRCAFRRGSETYGYGTEDPCECVCHATSRDDEERPF
jgi:hypothetical protein